MLTGPHTFWMHLDEITLHASIALQNRSSRTQLSRGQKTIFSVALILVGSTLVERNQELICLTHKDKMVALDDIVGELDVPIYQDLWCALLTRMRRNLLLHLQ